MSQKESYITLKKEPKKEHYFRELPIYTREAWCLWLGLSKLALAVGISDVTMFAPNSVQNKVATP